MTIAVAATMPMDDQSLVFLKGKVCWKVLLEIISIYFY
jgi:hypothetical protein